MRPQNTDRIVDVALASMLTVLAMVVLGLLGAAVWSLGWWSIPAAIAVGLGWRVIYPAMSRFVRDL